ncbi:MAG TPA: amidohydrolase family protein, partial [Solirubrobacter sp.]|nr:amidohydrolase family protein [Solirubrobacter sp.]
MDSTGCPLPPREGSVTGMTTSRSYLTHLAWALTADEDHPLIRDATLIVDNDRILAVGGTSELLAAHPPREHDDVRACAHLGATPGFVDSHVHLSETLARAVFPDVIDTRTWVFHFGKPFYAHVAEADEEVSVLIGTAEMLRCGTTCFLDMGAQNDPGITARAAARTGIRGIVGRHAADTKPAQIPRGWSDEMIDHHFFRDAETALEVLEQCVRDWNGYAGGRIRCWVNIEGKEPCSLELHVGARALAQSLGVGTTYHLASSLEESEISERRHGARPVTRIAQHDGLGSNLVIAHAVAVDDHEVEAMAAHGTSVAFCPGTSLKIAKGAACIGRYPEMIEHGVTVGLGTDGVAASGNLSLHRQMYVTAGLFKDARRDPTLLGAAQAFRMATIDGARALGMEREIGSLEAGKRADLILVSMRAARQTPMYDPLSHLVYVTRGDDVQTVIVNGKIVMEDRRVLTLNEKAVLDEATAW